MTKTVEEGSFVTLPCLSTKHTYFSQRTWYNKGRSTEKSDTLFQQDKGKDTIIDKGSLDMSINKDNFSLSIDPAKLKDNGTYTCCVYTDIPLQPDPKKCDHIELQMYGKY